MHRLDIGLCSHLKEFWGNRFRTNVYSKGKIPSTGKILPRGGSNPQHCIKQDSKPNTPPSYLAPLILHSQVPVRVATGVPILIIIIIIIIIIIAFKGAIRDFRFLTVLRTLSNTYSQATRAQSCANHEQHIECLSHATCCVACHMI